MNSLFKGTIKRSGDRSGDPEALPRAICFSALDLPAYPTREALEAELKIPAVGGSGGFDEGGCGAAAHVSRRQLGFSPSQ
jgi:hypothetical protein